MSRYNVRRYRGTASTVQLEAEERRDNYRLAVLSYNEDELSLDSMIKSAIKYTEGVAVAAAEDAVRRYKMDEALDKEERGKNMFKALFCTVALFGAAWVGWVIGVTS